MNWLHIWQSATYAAQSAVALEPIDLFDAGREHESFSKEQLRGQAWVELRHEETEGSFREWCRLYNNEDDWTGGINEYGFWMILNPAQYVGNSVRHQRIGAQTFGDQIYMAGVQCVVCSRLMIREVR